ncbi:MBOAT family protein [Paenibacillus albiflavus]|uniref:MBOAT family protein n=1 Tax=Paenibacillus albiflavus TaxID=2545760 RepID=A0A4R4E8X1_9BACL|nr:MBOAT family O-acyltransferase [Paenibacillus albiflavus]TCZ75433.1 MBOAT family protein [Paenibacillus albiflavus]
MVFSSLLFIFVFLPTVIILYYAAPRTIRNLLLFLCSLLFYAWGEPVYVLLMLFSTVIDYFHGLLIHHYLHNKRIAKWFVISSLTINLLILGFFKYANFLVQSANEILGTAWAIHELPLPIGISFYTFQTMSYAIDVYRGDAPVQRNIIAFGTYIALFPQLIAGPIVRYHVIADQLNHRRESIPQFANGIKLFIIGLAKKLLLANNIGMLWDEVRHMPAGELPLLTAWLGIAAFAMQIYYDFSGYSDMAIGLGRMFGFEFPRNFHYPYISQSISEFWRRWHMTLGAWFREYLYIPLGGNRVATWKVYRNLFVVWLATGLWHGASWNFALWGLYFGLIIVLEKYVILRLLTRSSRWISHAYTWILLLVSWVLFAFDELDLGFAYLAAMFGIVSDGLMNDQFIYLLYTNILLLLILILCATPIVENMVCSWKSRYAKLSEIVLQPVYLLLVVLSVAYLVDASYNPFLYFRF